MRPFLKSSSGTGPSWYHHTHRHMHTHTCVHAYVHIHTCMYHMCVYMHAHTHHIHQPATIKDLGLGLGNPSSACHTLNNLVLETPLG